MAIAVSDVMNLLPFVPNPDVTNPFPVGIWRAQRTQVTDASGGNVRWTVTPPPDLSRAYKFLWSLEDYSALTSSFTAAITIYMEVYTGEVVSRAGGSEVLRFARTEQLVGVVGTLTASYYFHFAPNMIHQPGGGNLNAYYMELTNLNAQVLTMSMWGYYWNSEARRLASGPRRP